MLRGSTTASPDPQRRATCQPLAQLLPEPFGCALAAPRSAVTAGHTRDLLEQKHNPRDGKLHTLPNQPECRPQPCPLVQSGSHLTLAAPPSTMLASRSSAKTGTSTTDKQSSSERTRVRLSSTRAWVSTNGVDTGLSRKAIRCSRGKLSISAATASTVSLCGHDKKPGGGGEGGTAPEEDTGSSVTLLNGVRTGQVDSSAKRT